MKQPHPWHERLCGLLRLSGLPWMMRELFARRKATLVNYHDPDPQTFSRHLAFFCRHYNLISLDRLQEALQSGKWSALPPKALVITLDDGHAGNRRLLPCFQSRHIPALIYVTTGNPGSRPRFWFKQVPMNGALKRELPDCTDDERRARLRRDYGYDDGAGGDSPGDGLLISELLALMKTGVQIGSHTASHPYLTRCEESVIRRELEDSRHVLEEQLQVPVRHFAYPGGAWNAQVRQQAIAAGYQTARTIDPGWVRADSDPWALPDFGISDDAGPHKAVVQACGLWAGLKRLALRMRSLFHGGLRCAPVM